MNDKADRLKTALRENLKRRKAHMRDRATGKAGERERDAAPGGNAEKSRQKES